MLPIPQITWLSLFALAIIILGTVFSVVLLVAKYPTAKQLGKLLFSYSLFLIPSLLDGLGMWKWIAALVAVVCYYGYLKSFFTQKTRLNYAHVVPVVLIVGVWV